jgi:hypothetical protein
MTKQQTGPTYLSQEISFVNTPQARTGTTTNKDQRLVNCFAETVRGTRQQKPKVFMTQRAGLQFSHNTAAGVSRGLYYFNGSVWSAVGNQLYRNSTPVQTLATSTGTVGFVEYAGSSSFPRNLIVLDGTNGWVIDTLNVITQITDPDFPTPHIPSGAYMDGYLFIVKAGTADIYNSNLDNPTAWTAGDFITAEMFPDIVITLIRQTDYIIAVGTNTTEYFYNAATFPGTPLARNPAAQHQIGTVSGDTAIVSEEQVIIVGETQLGGRSIWVFEAFKPIEIGTEEVRASMDAEGIAIAAAKLLCVRSMGHRFLILQLPSTARTWVFDFEEKLWHEWKNYNLTQPFPCDYMSSHPSGSAYMLDRTSGVVYKFTDNTGTDYVGGVLQPITFQATSEKVDFGTMDRKFGKRFTLMCDVPAPNLTFSIEWSDDDYQTWTTPRSIPISDTMPTIHQLGQFRRRAFKLTYSQPYPIRVESAEFDINMGNR